MKFIMGQFTFLYKVFKFGIYFIRIAHLSLDTKFSSQIFDLYLEFIKFTVEKVDSHSQVVPNILSFPIHKWSICFKMYI